MNPMTNPLNAVENNWLLLSFQGVYIGVRQSDVETILISSDLVVDKSKGNLFEMNNKQWPVFNLDKRLYPQATDERSFCVVIKDKGGFAGLMCELTQMFSAEQDSDIQPLPICMKKRISPFEYMTVFDDEVVCLGSGEKIIEYLNKISQLMDKVGGRHGRN